MTRRLILVEDKTTDVLVLAPIIRDAGFEMVLCVSAADARKRLTEEPSLAAVLVDLRLPEEASSVADSGAGMGLVRYLERYNRGRSRDLPVVLLTAFPRDPVVASVLHRKYLYITESSRGLGSPSQRL